MDSLNAWMRKIQEQDPLPPPASSPAGTTARALSVSVPVEIKQAVTLRAARLGLSRSYYICLLAEADTGKKI